MTRILSLMVFLSVSCFLLASCSGSGGSGGSSGGGGGGSSISISSKVNAVLPSPGSGASLMLTAPWWYDPVPESPSHLTNTTDWSWTGEKIFGLFADPSIWDPDTGVWGVQNIRENFQLASILSDTAQTAATGTVPLTVGTNTFSVVTSAPTAVTTVPLHFGFGTSASFSDAIPFTSGTGRVITFAAHNMTLDIAWTTSVANIFYILSASNSPLTALTVLGGGTSTSGEWDFMEGQYNLTTGDLRLNRACRDTHDAGVSYMVVRNNLTGNTTAKTFQAKIIQRNTDASDVTSNCFSMVAAGSSGATSSDVYMIKYVYSNSGNCSGTTYYMCLKGSVTAADFTTYATATGETGNGNGNGVTYYSSDTPVQVVTDVSNFKGNCLGNQYIATVTGMTPFTDADAPQTVSAWNATLGL